MILTKVSNEIIISKKSGRRERANALILLKSELLNNQKTEKPQDELQVTMSYAKKLEKALDMYSDENKLKELRQEISIIKEFLPKELTPEEIKEGVRNFLKENPSIINLGDVMKALKSAYPTQGKEVSTFAKAFLTGQESV
jgi:uncharacterized protein YqeY